MGTDRAGHGDRGLGGVNGRGRRLAGNEPQHLGHHPAAWIAENRPALGDLGYEGEADTITVAFKKPQGGQLTDEQKTHNKAHNGKHAVGERGNSLLKMTFKALRNISLCPWRIGKIVAAALVLLHIDHASPAGPWCLGGRPGRGAVEPPRTRRSPAAR
jgi:hypothetical protein